MEKRIPLLVFGRESQTSFTSSTQYGGLPGKPMQGLENSDPFGTTLEGEGDISTSTYLPISTSPYRLPCATPRNDIFLLSSLWWPSGNFSSNLVEHADQSRLCSFISHTDTCTRIHTLFLDGARGVGSCFWPHVQKFSLSHARVDVIGGEIMVTWFSLARLVMLFDLLL